jgi:TrmH family RNA methyltransferase
VHISKADIKLLRSLSQHKMREQHKKFIVEGWRALKDALNSGFRVDYVAVTPRHIGNPDYEPILREIEQRKITVKEISDAELQQISDTVHAQGVITLVDQKNASIADLGQKKTSLVVVADRIADPGNMGSIIRTCDWFGVDALILSEGCVDVYNDKVVRSTAGSIFHVHFVDHANVDDTLSTLKNLGFLLVGTAGEAKTSYAGVRYQDKTAIVIGSEANGLSSSARKLCDEMVKIERHGRAESLNVVVACGIILSHIRRIR